MDFVLHVTMDKAAKMQHPRNIARALERLANELDDRFGVNAEPAHAEGVVRDVSGSIVGRWELRP